MRLRAVRAGGGLSGMCGENTFGCCAREFRQTERGANRERGGTVRSRKHKSTHLLSQAKDTADTDPQTTPRTATTSVAEAASLLPPQE